jgi:hypothetical protein
MRIGLWVSFFFIFFFNKIISTLRAGLLTAGGRDPLDSTSISPAHAQLDTPLEEDISGYSIGIPEVHYFYAQIFLP